MQKSGYFQAKIINMEKIPVSDEKRDLFLKLVETIPEIQPKGKTTPYTSYNGNMFTVFSTAAKLGMRMSKENQAAFAEKYGTGAFISYGATMKDYVEVPDDLLARTDELSEWFSKSWEFAQSLKPKATKKKKK